MKKIIVLLFISLSLLAIGFLTPVNAFAGDKGKHSHTKKHHHRHGSKHIKKQSVSESLKLLKTYLPEYSDDTDSPDNYTINSNLTIGNNFDRTSVFADATLRKKLIENIDDWLGTRYRFAGHSRKGIDCSNFVACMVEETLGVPFPANAKRQSGLFSIIENLDDLQFGDLIFFSGTSKKSNRIGHVGFYLGHGLFAHSSTGRGVIYTHISEGYYAERYRFGGRFLNSEWAAAIKLAKN